MTRRIVLGIETTGPTGSVATWSPEDPAVESLHSFDDGMIHGVAVAPAVRDVIRGLGLSPADLALIAVGTGPGSFTGVRIGVSFAKGLAFAADVPVVGVGTFAAGAGSALPPGETGHVVYARDARRDTVYLAVYRVGTAGTEEIVAPRLAPLDQLPDLLPDHAIVVGDAFGKYGDVLSGEGRTPAGDSREPDARDIARFGEMEFQRRGPDDTHDLTPLYLRKTEAEERLREAGGSE